MYMSHSQDVQNGTHCSLQVVVLAGLAEPLVMLAIAASSLTTTILNASLVLPLPHLPLLLPHRQRLLPHQLIPLPPRLLASLVLS